MRVGLENLLALALVGGVTVAVDDSGGSGVERIKCVAGLEIERLIYVPLIRLGEGVGLGETAVDVSCRVVGFKIVGGRDPILAHIFKIKVHFLGNVVGFLGSSWLTGPPV